MGLGMSDVELNEVIALGDRALGIRFVIIETAVTTQRVLDLCIVFWRLRIDIRNTSFNIELSLLNFKFKFGIGVYNEG